MDLSQPRCAKFAARLGSKRTDKCKTGPGIPHRFFQTSNCDQPHPCCPGSRPPPACLLYLPAPHYFQVP
eukprot:366555-Chlamydomonas_euryale.AAC.11